MFSLTRKFFYTCSAGVLGFVASFSSLNVVAQPFELSYGGRLTETSGKPVDGPVDLEINFFRSETGNDRILIPVLRLNNTPLSQGVFQVRINLPDADFQAVFADGTVDVYIQISDITHTVTYPRQKFLAVPYAFRVPVDPVIFGWNGNNQLTFAVPPVANKFLKADGAANLSWVDVLPGTGDMQKSSYDANDDNKVDSAENSDQLGGQNPAFYRNAGNLNAGKVPAAQLTFGAAAGTVTEGNDARLSDARPPSGSAGGDLAGSTFPNPTIANNAVTSSKIASGAVGTTKIANSAVDNTKIAAGAVDTANLVDSAVDGNKLAANAVTSAKIADGAVDLNDLNPVICAADQVLKMNGAGTALGCAADADSGGDVVKGGQTGPLVLGTINSSNLSLLTNNTTRMVIDNNGNIGINAAPTATSRFSVTQSAQAGTAEVVAGFAVADDAVSYLAVINAVTTDNQFAPRIIGESIGNLIPMGLIGRIANDTGLNAAIMLDGRTNVPGALTTRPILEIRNNGATKVHVDKDGRIGVGLDGTGTLPQAPFHSHVPGAGSPTSIRFTNGSTGVLAADGFSVGYSTFGYLWNPHTTMMQFATSNTERLRIEANGALGINQSTPVERLHVGGNIRLGQAPATATTVSGAHTTVVTTITVVSTAGYPGMGTLFIGNEAITYSGITATTFNSATRGALGTTAQTFAGGETVNIYLATAANSATTPQLVLTNQGRMGMGTVIPSDSIHVRATGSGVRNRLRLEVTGNTSDQDSLITFTDSGESVNWSIGADDTSDRFIISNSAELGTSERIEINSSGHVTIMSGGLRVPSGTIGVGTSSPGYDVHVVKSGNKASGTFESYSDYPRIMGMRAQGTSASPSAVTSGQNLLLVSGRGYGTSSFSSDNVSITFEAAENWTDADQGTRIVFKTTPNGTTAPTEAMRIGQDGRVGIGTSSPQSTLDINGTVRLAINSAQPYACDATKNGALALTSIYTMCVCKGGISTWVRVSDGTTGCTW